jgi:hypothetical protein
MMGKKQWRRENPVKGTERSGRERRAAASSRGVLSVANSIVESSYITAEDGRRAGSPRHRRVCFRGEGDRGARERERRQHR